MLHGIFLSQRNFALQLVDDVGLLASKPVNTPMDPRQVLNDFIGELLEDPTKYRCLVDRLLNLNITRPDMDFIVQPLS